MLVGPFDIAFTMAIVCSVVTDNEAQRKHGDDRGGSVTNNLNFAAGSSTAGAAPERKAMTPVATLEMTDSEYV